MKFIIGFVLLLSTAVNAQDKNVNVIIAKNVSFKNVVTSLLDAGFQIDKLDSTYSTVKTDFKKICLKCDADYLLNVRVKDNTAYITGKWKNTLVASVVFSGSDPVFDIKNERGGIPKQSFEAMNNFAKSLSKDVSYLKQ